MTSFPERRLPAHAAFRFPSRAFEWTQHATFHRPASTIRASGHKLGLCLVGLLLLCCCAVWLSILVYAASRLFFCRLSGLNAVRGASENTKLISLSMVTLRVQINVRERFWGGAPLKTMSEMLELRWVEIAAGLAVRVVEGVAGCFNSIQLGRWDGGIEVGRSAVPGGRLPPPPPPPASTTGYAVSTSPTSRGIAGDNEAHIARSSRSPRMQSKGQARTGRRHRVGAFRNNNDSIDREFGFM